MEGRVSLHSELNETFIDPFLALPVFNTLPFDVDRSVVANALISRLYMIIDRGDLLTFHDGSWI